MPPDSLEEVRAWFRSRRTDYHQTFRGLAGQRVLRDLAKFCHANDTTHVAGDPAGSAQLEGRRQVWLRIQLALNLDPETMMTGDEGDDDE